MSDSELEAGFWLFGYGSLIWKPPPHHDQRLPGYVEGYVRRFWQASEDHRGTPSAPGRVVTLITRSHWETLTDSHQNAPSRTWGAAYHIPAAHVSEVRAYLDLREINGYSITWAPFHPVSSPGSDASVTETGGTGYQEPIKTMVYIGLPTNPQFVGPQDPDELASHILRSKGPSGDNREYLYLLEKSLKELSPESGDEHVSDLALRARIIERDIHSEGGGHVMIMNNDENEDENRLTKVGSTDEQEEVEKE